MRYIQNLCLILESAVQALIFGQANRLKEVATVLVVQTGKLGDMVCTTPVLRAFRQYRPDVRICVLGNAINKEVLAESGLVDEYISLDSGRLINELRTRNIDAAFLLSPNTKTLAQLYRARIPFITAFKITHGWSPYQTLTYRTLLRLVVPIPHNMTAYAPREYLRSLEHLGILTKDTTKALKYSQAGLIFILEYLRKSGIEPVRDFCVGISPAAGNKIKEWGVEKFAKLANKISAEFNATIVIIGGPGNESLAHQMQELLDPSVRYINTTGSLSIDMLKALISQLKILIAVDTGPIYIAEAFNIPTIDIVGPVDENVQPPRSERNLIVRADVQGYPFLRIMNARVYDEQQALKSTEAITVEMVWNSFKVLWYAITHVS